MATKNVPINVPCPVCGEKMNLKVKTHMVMPDDQVWKNRIMDGKLFALQCKKCGNVKTASFRCSYDDMENRFLVWVIPILGPKEKESVKVYNEQLKTDDALRLARNDYKLRVVRTDKELKEKITIFEEGLDDRIIELMKFSFIPVVREKFKITSDIKEFYFMKNSETGEYNWLIFFEDHRPMVGYFDMEMYENIKKDSGELVKLLTGEGLTTIDIVWATAAMRVRMSGDPSKEEIDAQELVDNYKKLYVKNEQPEESEE